MFSIQICRYSLDNLKIEILKVVGKRKIYQDKGSQGSPKDGHLAKKFAHVAEIWQILKICPQVLSGGRRGGDNAWKCNTSCKTNVMIMKRKPDARQSKLIQARYKLFSNERHQFHRDCCHQ